MKNLNEILILGALFGGLMSPPLAFAEKMNLETQDLVITRMERVLSTLERSDSAYLSSQQRLADLLSERARARFMIEMEQNCKTPCKGSKDDRVKAVKIYEDLLKTTKAHEHGPILFQLAHLYEMAGQVDKAINLYESIVRDSKKKQIKSEIVSRSRVGAGDLLFQKGKFTQARAHYLIALKDKSLPNSALTVYNLAWCEFNNDKLPAAIKTLEDLLKKPEQIVRETEEGVKFDSAFQTDILRDLGTFYSKKDVSSRDIKMFESLTPDDKKKDLLLYFANETDRIGQKKAAHEIMNRYLAVANLSKEEHIEASLKLAQIAYDRGDTAQSIQEFNKAAAFLKSNGCKKEKCESLTKAMKHYVTELHRSKKLKPDNDLLSAYVTYNQTFPGDRDMTMRGAQVATEMQNYPVAMSLYRAISVSSSFSDKERNEALLNEISVAEKSKDVALQADAYYHYLKYSKDPVKSFEVRYQLAYLSYQEKQFQQAAEDFTVLAKDTKGTASLRKKAADLSLDALLQTKNEKSLEYLAWEYATIFPSARTEFEGIARKTLMNSVAKTANDKNSSKSDLKASLKSLDDRKLQNASSAEKILFFNNQSVLASKVGDDEAYVKSLTALLGVSALTKEQRESTLAQLTAFHEKRLDFKSAYEVSVKMSFPNISEQEKQIRLGTLADLAEMNAEKHYRKAIKVGLKGMQGLVIRARLVLISENPVKELNIQSKELRSNPTLLNETTLLVYGKTGNANGLSSILSLKEMRNQSAPLFIAKQSFYAKVQKEGARIASHKLNISNDRQMQRTLGERVKMLSQIDGLLEESLKLKDVTSQMLVLNIMTAENQRMVQDLASLPLPPNLSQKEMAQYVNLMKAQSKPYLVKAKVAHQKQQDVWNRSAALASTIKDYRIARPELRPLLGRELSLLSSIAGQGPMKETLESALSERAFSSRDLQSARQSVAGNPADLKELQNLKLIETKIGHPLMPTYLEARINHLQKGKSL